MCQCPMPRTSSSWQYLTWRKSSRPCEQYLIYELSVVSGQLQCAYPFDCSVSGPLGTKCLLETEASGKLKLRRSETLGSFKGTLRSFRAKEIFSRPGL